MSTIPTCAVRSTFRDSVGGEPIANATITARLSSYEIYEGFVVPRDIVAKSDENGEFVLDLFPNELGAVSSFYEIKLIAPNGKTLRTTAVVPNLTTVDLADISDVPPYDGKLNISLADVNAAVLAAAEASSAAVAAAETTTSDRTITTQARNDAQAARDAAVPAAATATEKADVAVAAASSALDSANTATGAQTVVVAARDESVAARDEAVPAAVTAAEKAGITITKAGEATNSAAVAVDAAAQAADARDGALANSGIQPDEPTGRLTVADGQTFLSQSSDPAIAYLIYRRINAGTPSTLIGVQASKQATDNAIAAAGVLRGDLGDGGMLDHTGSGPVIPIVADADNRAVLWYDTSEASVKGAGLLTDASVPAAVSKQLGNYSEAAFTGVGPKIPFISDSDNRIVFGFDTVTNKLFGEGLSQAGEGDGASALLPLASPPIPKALNHLLFYGQSLSIGAQGLPILSTTQPYSNKTFTSGPRAAGGDYSSLKPLVEDSLTAPDGGTNRGETVCSGAANYATTLAALDGRDPASHVIFASTAGCGGFRIDQLNKASAWYPHLTAHVSGAHALNANHAVHAVGWIQGENDAITGQQTPYATYRAALSQLQVDMDADIKAITGQTAPVYVLTYQMSYAARTWPDQAKAQLDLAQKNDKFVLVTPTYHLPHFTDNVHLTAIGYKWMGAYFGRAYKQMVIDGKRPKWLNPLSATRRGKLIRVRFDVPYGPLVLDTATLATTTDFGFKVLDGVSTAAISSIAVNGSELLVTLASLPAGAVTFRAGLDYLGAGLTFTGGGSTNLRDSDPTFITIGSINYPLYNVCPHFELPVVTLGE